MERLRSYKKEDNHSYSLGPFPTFEMVEAMPQIVKKVIIDEAFNERERLEKILNQEGIAFSYEKKTLERIGNKKQCYVAGVFEKYTQKLEKGNHLVLDNIRDMGNMGTIIRSMAAFGIMDLALIGNVCDIFNPKVVRATMGSLFRIRHCHFETLEDYLNEFPDNNLYAFVLDEKSQELSNISPKFPYSAVFGNEGKGLGKEYYTDEINKVFINQSQFVDSLNLTIAVGIGLYTMERNSDV